MNDALKHPKRIDQASNCGYFWKKSDKVYSTLSIIERQASILQVASECNKQGRKPDHKQSFVNSYFVSISDGFESKKRSVNKLTKHLSLPRSTRCRLFSKYNTIREQLINNKVNVKWSSVSRRKGRYPLIRELFKTIIQEWIIKYPSVVASPIAQDTILIRDKLTGKKNQRVGKY